MNMLAKIALIIVILACAGSLYFAYTLDGMKKQFKADNEQLTADKARLEGNLGKANNELATTKKTLEQTLTDLTSAKESLQARQEELAKKSQEAESAVALANELKQQVKETTTKLALAEDTFKKIQEIAELADLRNIEELRNKLLAQAEERKILSEQLVNLHSQNQQMAEEIRELKTTPVDVRGRIAAVEDRWGFLVLDVGRDVSVRPNTQFLIMRDSKIIGKANVVSVGENTSIAEIIPEHRHGTPRAGDLVVR